MKALIDREKTLDIVEKYQDMANEDSYAGKEPDYYNYLDRAFGEIEELNDESPDEWHKVTDENPPYYKPLLCYYKSFQPNYCVLKYMHDGKYYGLNGNAMRDPDYWTQIRCVED